MSFDPVRLEILWSGLVSIAEEMGVTLKKTAYSEMVREANDFSCALFDHDGNMIAQTDYIGSPGHLGSVRDAVKIMLREFPADSLNPGDSLITNDPYLVAGHLPDIAIATPIFFGGNLMGFALNITHHTDIGGKVAGGHLADSREIFEEGLRIPVSKFYSQGTPNRDLIRFIESNVRVPYKEIGDFNAQLSSNFVAARRLEEFVKDFRLSIEDFHSLGRQIIDTTETAMRSSFAEFEKGKYQSSELMESFDGDSSIELKLAIEVREDKVIADYTGSGAQSPNGMNSPFNYTFAYTSHAIKCATNPRIPMNEGVMKTIEMIVPEGTILNPKFPAAVGGRHLVNWRLNSLVFRALSKTAPERVIAPSGGTGSNMPQYSGIHSKSRKPFVQIVNHSGGLGARPKKDGIHCYPFPARAENTPVEIVETVAPILIEKLELIQDSGGAGKFRGGSGVEMDVKVTNEDGVILLNISGRDVYPAQGLFGGMDGGKSEILYLGNGKSRVRKRLHPRKIVNLEQGSLVRFKLPGGGGYGDPAERDVRMVVEDLQDGLISPNAARSIYKVVVNARNFAFDEGKTEQLRRRSK